MNFKVPNSPPKLGGVAAPKAQTGWFLSRNISAEEPPRYRSGTPPNLGGEFAFFKHFHTFIGVICLIAAASLAFAGGTDLRLVEAVKSNDSAAVRSLLKSSVDVNSAQGDGATALHWAVHHDDLATTDLLLHAGARANATNDLGVPPLYLACTNRNALMIEKLLAAGANPNAKLLNGETVLMNCARTGSETAVKALLNAGADANAKEPEHGQTALMWAAAEKHPEAVHLLIDAEADIRARSRTYSQTVTSEITQRAGREELNYTVLRGGSTPLLFGARSGDAESVRLLIAAGADVNDALPNGMSALVLAAHSGQGAVASLLLEKGADPNAAGIGYTAIHAAVLRGDVNLVSDLLRHGANPNAVIVKGTPLRRNNEDYNLPATLIGATPFWLAAKYLEPDIIRALAATGADPEKALADGTTPLMAAAGMKEGNGRGGAPGEDRRGLSLFDGGKLPDESRIVDTATTVLLQPLHIDAVNKNGDTALHAAALLGYDRVVKLLADKGAKLTVKNNRGVTPLSSLAGRGTEPLHPGTADLLRKLGAVE